MPIWTYNSPDNGTLNGFPFPMTGKALSLITSLTLLLLSLAVLHFRTMCHLWEDFLNSSSGIVLSLSYWVSRIPGTFSIMGSINWFITSLKFSNIARFLRVGTMSGSPQYLQLLLMSQAHSRGLVNVACMNEWIYMPELHLCTSSPGTLPPPLTSPK